MPALENTKHEAFVQGVFSGKSQRQSYHDAGYETNDAAADVAASRLLSDVRVQARLNELKEAMAERVVERELLTLETAVKFMLMCAQEARTIGKEKKDPAGFSSARGSMAEAAKLMGLYPEKTPANTIYVGADGKQTTKPQTGGTSINITIAAADRDL